MRFLIRLWPAAAGVLVALALLAVLRIGPAQAVVQSIVHTTVTDFNQGTFYRTGLTQQGDGEVTLLTVGIAGEWITTTNTTGFVPRSEHAAIAANNRIYVFGGRTAVNTLTSIQYADVNVATHNLSNWVTASVSLAGVYPAGISTLSAAYLNGYVYLIGGYSSTEDDLGITSTVSFARIQSDGSLAPFAKTATLPQRLSRTDTVVLNGRLYVIGGRGHDNSAGRDTVYYAQPDAGSGQIAQWLTATAALPYRAFGHEAFTASGYLYLAGGVSNTALTGGVVPNVYFAAPNPTTGNIAPGGWISTEVLPFPLYEAASASFGGQLYSTGGSASAFLAGDPSDFVGVALPNDDGAIPPPPPPGGWINTSLIFPARFAHATVVNSDGWIYVIGGTVGLNQPITASIVNAGATTGAGGSYARLGRYTSSIIDLTKNFRLQNLRWTTYLGDTSSVSLTMRYQYRTSTGSWSGWSPPLPSLNVAGTATTTHPLTPTARYFQYEATFTSTGGLTTPILSRVELVYDTPDPPDLDKLASPPGGGSVLAGQRITYTLRYSNTEDLVFHNVIISDRVPVSTTYVPGSIFGVGANAGGNPDLIWQLGDLQPHTGGEVGYAVTVDANVPDGAQIPNIADLFSDEGDSQSRLVIHTVGEPLAVDKSAVTSAPGQAGSTVQPGDRITYTLAYSNTSAANTRTSVVITDQLPLHLNYAGAFGAIAPDTSLLASQRILRWNIGSLPPRTGGTVGFFATVADSAPNGSTLDNAGEIDSSETGSTTSITVTHVVLYRFDLSLSKSDGKTTALAGEQLIYTLQVTNTAANPVTATGIVITDYIEPGLPGLATTMLSFAGGTPGWQFVEVDAGGNAIYAYPFGALGPNQSRAITLVVRVADTIPVDVLAVRNSAEIGYDSSSGIDTDPTNDFAFDTDIVRGADVAVTDISLLTGSAQQATVVVTLVNQGLEATLGPDGNGWFGSDLYVKPAGSGAPTGPGDRHLGACPTPTNYCPDDVRLDLYRITKFYPGEGLAQGETWVLTYTYSFPGAGTYWLYAQADVFWGEPGNSIWGTAQNGRLVEGDEDNNIFGPLTVNVGGGQQQVFLPIVLKNP